MLYTLHSSQIYYLITEAQRKREVENIFNKNDIIELTTNIAEKINNLVIMLSNSVISELFRETWPCYSFIEIKGQQKKEEKKHAFSYNSTILSSKKIMLRL